MEYELLERVIECGLQSQLKNIQVQFHKIGDDYEERYEKIRAELLKTHHLTYDYPFVWQNFTLNE
jgi:DNA-binding ferritin-like protein (Dps family)